jgi:hypothetical protein
MSPSRLQESFNEGFQSVKLLVVTPAAFETSAQDALAQKSDRFA